MSRLDVTAITGLDRRVGSRLSASIIGRAPRTAEVWVDPSSGFLGFVSATFRDGSGWIEQLDIPVDSSCLGCAYLDAVVQCIQRIHSYGRYSAATLLVPPSVEADAFLEQLCARLDPKHLRLDTAVAVISGSWLDDLAGDSTIGERGAGLSAGDDRALSELLAAQLNVADFILVAAPEITSDESAVLSALAPTVLPLVSRHPQQIGVELLVGTGRHRPRCLNSFESEGLLDPHVTVHPTNRNVSLVRWRATRPLHAERLHDVLEAICDDVVRSSGVIVIASTCDRLTRWESAGTSMTLGDLGPRGRRGMHSEIALLGLGADPDRIRELLGHCVLTDDELREGPDSWAAYDDPFAVGINDGDHDE